MSTDHAICKRPPSTFNGASRKPQQLLEMARRTFQRTFERCFRRTITLFRQFVMASAYAALWS